MQVNHMTGRLDCCWPHLRMSILSLAHPWICTFGLGIRDFLGYLWDIYQHYLLLILYLFYLIIALLISFALFLRSWSTCWQHLIQFSHTCSRLSGIVQFILQMLYFDLFPDSVLKTSFVLIMLFHFGVANWYS